MSKAGDIVFANLPIIFAMGVAIGMAKKEKEVAALAGAIGFFIMHTAIGAMLDITGAAATMPNGSVTQVVGITSLQMGVFGGIIVGLGVAALHNKFYKIKLPQVLSFFGGTRFCANHHSSCIFVCRYRHVLYLAIHSGRHLCNR